MEAAGFAVGVVALASLFSTCVELLDYIELGKNYLQDYKLACNKINILHTRLTIWGVTARILLPGDEHPLLRIPAKRDAVSEGLQSLKDVLQDTELLRRKYDLSTHKPACQSNAKDPAGSPKIANWSHLLRKRTTWSIRDKAKFDKFIADISFLMGNLEKVTETLDSSDDGKNTSLQQHQPGAKTRQGNAAATSTESISDQPAPAATAAGGAFLLEFTGNHQTNTDQSSGLMGTVGLPPGRMRFADNEQQNSNKSDGVVGAMTEAAYASGRKGKFDLVGTADKEVQR